jgi:hypothetical protein
MMESLAYEGSYEPARNTSINAINDDVKDNYSAEQAKSKTKKKGKEPEPFKSGAGNPPTNGLMSKYGVTWSLSGEFKKAISKN